MDNVPEFAAQGIDRVQGGTYPARIWGAYMEQAHVFLPVADWSAPPPNGRQAARLYLPGNECLFRIVGYEGAATSNNGIAPATVV